MLVVSLSPSRCVAHVHTNMRMHVIDMHMYVTDMYMHVTDMHVNWLTCMQVQVFGMYIPATVLFCPFS